MSDASRMRAMGVLELGPLQIRALKALFRLGEGTVHEIRAGMGEFNQPAYITLLTVLRRMENRNVLTHRLQGRQFVYRPLLDEETFQRRVLDQMISHVFGSADALWDALEAYE